MIPKNIRMTIVYSAAIIGILIGFAISLFELYHGYVKEDPLTVGPFLISGSFLLISAAILFYDAVARALEMFSKFIPFAHLRPGGQRSYDPPADVTEETEVKKEGE